MSHQGSLLILPHVYDPRCLPWDAIRADVLRIEGEQFGEGAFDEEYLKEEFEDPDNVAVLLWDTAGKRIAGFTYAVPVGGVHQEREPESLETAYICDTALDAPYQRRGLIGELMGCLEEELRRRGYRYLERDAAVANGYAETISRAYWDRIVVKSDPHQSEWGLQVFFRIRL